MAGTRTVYRGSHGRFAGASGGRAEKVRVGSGYVRGTSASAGNARPKPGRITQMRNRRAAARQANNVKPLNPNVKPRSRPVSPTHSHPAGLVNRSKPARVKYAVGNVASHAIGSKAPGKVKAARNLVIGTAVAGGVGALAGHAIGTAARHHRDSKPTTYRGIGVGRKETVSMPRTALRPDATVGGRSVKSGAFVAGVGRAAASMQGHKTTPNYNLAKGKKEYVGRRLKPGEGRGFKLAGL